MEVTGAAITVEKLVYADPGAVWDVLADLPRTARWSPESQAVRWLDGASAAVPGARFSGRNRDNYGTEWEVTGVITEADRPTRLAWVVLDATGDPTRPSSTWWYELSSPAAGQTLIRQHFVHGPGGSGLRDALVAYPTKREAIIRMRLTWLSESATRTLTAMAEELGWLPPGHTAEPGS